MHEVELKSVVDDVELRRARLEAAGARLIFAGRLEDRRFDMPGRELAARDHVLRSRIERDSNGEAVRAMLEWKGPTVYTSGYKVREELSVGADDPATLAELLGRLGFVVTLAIDREVVVYAFGDATIRFELYPRMDALVEVEGDPAAIERAIVALGLPRGGFTSERLQQFSERYAARTGIAPALSDDELAGSAQHHADDA